MGSLPILIGGNGERRTLRLVAQYADMWNGYGDAETIRAKNAAIDRWCAELGRNPREIERTVWIERADPDLIAALADAGAEHVILGLRAPYDLSEVERLVAAR
jgi:alkanesulfonate monooxygenase SsuD/methylene tetrahydromethanopterin reductase-like flavin-dependent oxidoreductase (luciferase family)